MLKVTSGTSTLKLRKAVGRPGMLKVLSGTSTLKLRQAVLGGKQREEALCVPGWN